MRRRDLDREIKKLAKDAGAAIYMENGSNHDKWFVNGILIVVPRHSEISEMLAKSIIRDARNATNSTPHTSKRVINTLGISHHADIFV